MITNERPFLLFIEPKNPPARTPLIDDMTIRMATALLHGTRGTMGRGGFVPGAGYKGWHSCACGAMGGSSDILLPSGDVTNDLALHYLARHREEVPADQLGRVALMPRPAQVDSTLLAFLNKRLLDEKQDPFKKDQR